MRAAGRQRAPCRSVKMRRRADPLSVGSMPVHPALLAYPFPGRSVFQLSNARAASASNPSNCWITARQRLNASVLLEEFEYARLMPVRARPAHQREMSIQVQSRLDVH